MESKKIHVLIADSDTSSAETLKNYLEKGGYTVDALAFDGVDAVSLCIKAPPDVIFVDSKLKLIDGYKVSSYICSKGFEGTIILISEKYDENMSQALNENGIDGCVVKPVTEKFLLPWLHTKLTRTEDIKSLNEEKRKLLLTLENKRLIEGANGLISSSMNVSISEADKILTEKAKERNMAKEELAKIFVSALTK